MRKFFAFLPAIALSLIAAPAIAAEATPPPAKPAAATPENRLNTLFGELKRERNERAAERIAGRIQEEWNRSGSASVDLMMQWSQKAMQEEKFDVALDFLDQVITLRPSYAEGWNRRATVHFMMRSFGKSMADIDRTLQLEPRHFGALAGLAQIMKERDSKELALDAYQRVLDIYPMLRSAQNEVATLSEELAGEGI
jgi:tetratricopeptide (TPR) repeat protein